MNTRFIISIITLAALCGGCSKLDSALLKPEVTTTPALVDSQTGAIVATREHVTDDNPGGTMSQPTEKRSWKFAPTAGQAPIKRSFPNA
ncbi:MAG: hypothetical protein O3C21_13610 [Verrucomicrobia bacterium]|nr:hypothetical protein [Verrucomicrobiota bacterium]